MGSAGSPNSWAPYDSYRDCSQGICSIYCPQWCYMVFPPPPPLVPPDEDAYSTPNFSPLIIAVIGILASAFLLTTYYTIISKYCNRARRTRDDDQNPVPELESSRDQTNLAQAGSTGLDETVIKSIAVCKYKKGDGLVEGTECSVCLSEFQEGESLRLLPKCSHAFHLNCIDTWLKSQSNCPLCRASVVKLATPPPPNSSVQTSSSTRNVISSLQIHPQNDLILTVDNDDDLAQRVHSEEDEEEIATAQQIRRSISLGSFACRGHLLVADILRASEDDEDDVQMGIPTAGVGTSRGEASSWENSRNEVLRRSITTGRFSFRKA